MSKWFGQVLKFGIVAGAVAALVAVTQGMEPFGRALLVIGMPLWYYVSITLDDLSKRIGLERLPAYPLDRDSLEPIVPKHETVALPTRSSDESLHCYRPFFAHFAAFAAVFNKAMEQQGSPWRLQDRAETNLTDDRIGRAFTIFFGRKCAGHMSMWPAHVAFFPQDGNKREGYSANNPEVRFKVKIWDARSLNSDRLDTFFDELFELLACKDVAEMANARSKLRESMIDAMWRLGPKVVENTTLQFHFTGPATRYILLARDHAAHHRGQRTEEAAVG